MTQREAAKLYLKLQKKGVRLIAILPVGDGSWEIMMSRNPDSSYFVYDPATGQPVYRR